VWPPLHEAAATTHIVSILSFGKEQAMRCRSARVLSVSMTVGIAVMLVTMPVRAYGQDPADHAAHHPAVEGAPAPAPPAAAPSNATKLDALVKKMNAAKGAAKTDAIAEVLTALVEEHRACQPMMANMMKMMQGMDGHQGSATPNQPPAR
jgi:hypothetical protein